jgi:hypothetical protein
MKKENQDDGNAHEIESVGFPEKTVKRESLHW